MMGEPASLEEFRDRIEAEFGLVFDESRREQVEEALLARRTQLDLSARDYLARLESDRAEWDRIAALLTVPESYFFRHTDHLRAFTDVALPERMAAHPADRTLRIQSIGCASGEEPYTLAMTLRERADLLTGWTVSLRACDINPEALRRAERGFYTNWALRATPPACRSRYFEAAGNRFRIADEIRRSVVFEEANALALYRPEAAESLDIVFFRNVLIYFSPEAIRAAVSAVAHLLAPGGYLFLGPAETLRGISDDFVLCHTHETFYYRRKPSIGAFIPFSPLTPVPLPRYPFLPDMPDMPDLPLPMDFSLVEGAAPAPQPGPAETAWMEEIERSSERIRGLHDGQQARTAPRSVPGMKISSRPGAPSQPAHRSPAEALQHLLALFSSERYREAIDEIGRLPQPLQPDPDVQLVRALAHLNSGEIPDAEKVCQAVLARDSMNGSGHYILALCREHARDLAGAAEHDRIAIYLDPSFAMPHLHLALTARRAGDLRAARREFEQANLLLARESASRLMMFGGGFTREALREICRRELRAPGEA